MTTNMTSAVLERLAQDVPLAEEQRRWLLETHDLVQLGLIASEVRQRVVGATATFVRVDEVPIGAVGEHALAADAGERRIVGDPASLPEAVAAVKTLAARSRGVAVTGFALDVLAGVAADDLRRGLTALHGAGLTAIAEARLDRLDDDHVAAVAEAGLTIHSIAPGVAVTGDAWLAALDRVATLQRRHGNISAFQPLPRESSVTDPSTGYDDMRAVATARILLDAVPRIQVHWLRAGAKLAQACLLFGANDIDAVPAHDPMPHGPRRSVLAEVRRNITAVALDPVERTASFEPRLESAQPETAV